MRKFFPLKKKFQEIAKDLGFQTSYNKRRIIRMSLIESQSYFHLEKNIQDTKSIFFFFLTSNYETGYKIKVEINETINL
jgi:hypothetical protein